MITVDDYIKNNDNVRISIARKESRDECHPFERDVWEGMLYDIPENLRKAEVINGSQDGYLKGQMNHLSVYY